MLNLSILLSTHSLIDNFSFNFNPIELKFKVQLQDNDVYFCNTISDSIVLQEDGIHQNIFDL
jgi:hypothetical protein